MDGTSSNKVFFINLVKSNATIHGIKYGSSLQQASKVFGVDEKYLKINSTCYLCYRNKKLVAKFNEYNKKSDVVESLSNDMEAPDLLLVLGMENNKITGINILTDIGIQQLIEEYTEGYN